MDNIKRYSKNKGYESLPRELLQSTEISLEAIGLLVNMQSYPDTWVLRKTELRNRFKNGAKMIDRIWDELVEHGYIVQFRRREGKKYVYQYFFNVEKFSWQEVQDMLWSMAEDGMMLYHKNMLKNLGSPINLKDYLYLSDEDMANLDLSFWDSQKGNLKECDDTGIFWTSRFGHSNLDFPKGEHSRFTIKRFTNKEIEEEDNNIIANSEIEKDEFLENKLEQFSECVSDERIKYAAQYLSVIGLDTQTVIDLSLSLRDKRDLLVPELIVQQAEWCQIKSKTSGIGDYVKYFIGGLEKRFESLNVESKREYTQSYYEKSLGYGLEKAKVPMIDWVNG